MANLLKEKLPSGWNISICDFKLNTTLATRTHKISAAKRLLGRIQARIDKLNENRADDFYSYSTEEKRRFIKTGIRPVKLQRQRILLGEAIEDFLQHKKETGKAHQTLEGYRIKLSQIVEYFGVSFDLEDLTNEQIQDFVFRLRKKRNTAGRNIGACLGIQSIKKIVQHLSMLIRWCIAKRSLNQKMEIFAAIDYGTSAATELQKLTPWTDFEKRTAELKRFDICHSMENAFSEIIFTKSQLFELLQHLETSLWCNGTVESRRFFAAVYFVAVTGIRRSEIARVRRCDLLLNHREVNIWLRKGRKDKSLKSHKRYLPEIVIPYLETVLKELPQDQECLFVDDDKHLTGVGYDEEEERKKADSLTNRLILAYKNSKWQHAAGFHKFRHSLASILLVEGKTQMEVKETIGWCSDEMAQRYQHLQADRKMAIVDSVFSSCLGDPANV